MVCRICGSREYFAKAFTNKSFSKFTRKELEYGTPAVHVLHDLAAQMNIPIDLVETSIISELDVAHLDASNFNVSEFEPDDKQDNEPDLNELEIFDALDEVLSAHHIAFFMKNPHATHRDILHLGFH